jgi:hypothetical protein
LSIAEIDGMIFPIAAFGRSGCVEGAPTAWGTGKRIFGSYSVNC